MSEVVRVPKEQSGTNDTVKLEAKCAITDFRRKNMKQEITDCAMVASWENGAFSINFTEKRKRKSVTIRLDELLVVLQEASEARKTEAKHE